jgi:hypothetical protein
VHFADEPALPDLTARVAAHLADLGRPEHLDPVVVAIARVEQAVVGKLRAVQRAAEERGPRLALVELSRPQTNLVAGVPDDGVLGVNRVLSVRAEMPDVLAGGR